MRLYQAERDIIHSAFTNDITVVHAAHMVGKDFTAAATVVLFFLTREPCRILTTSVDGPQLSSVLWGEMRRLAMDSMVPLDASRGGPLHMQHMHWRKVYRGQLSPLSYCIGRVARTEEGLSGHHIAQTGDGIPRTMAVVDEASGVPRGAFSKLDEWANRQLWIGNPYDCDNPFRDAVEGRLGTEDRGGDIPRKDGATGYHRRVLRITALDSPNVRLGLAEAKKGRKPSGRQLVPGVLPYAEYVKRLATWDPEKRCVGLDALFWRGASVKLFPPEALAAAEELARQLEGVPRQALAIGIDSGMGRADTSFVATDALGVVEWQSWKTPDTDQIVGALIDFASRLGVPPEEWAFDAGGGGKQHADRLRAMGYPVRIVDFGGSVAGQTRSGRSSLEERRELQELRAAYNSRRSQMYGELAETVAAGWAIPRAFGELHRQLGAIPRRYDSRGKLRIPPKRSDGNEQSMHDLIGCSPDEADATVLAVHAMRHKEWTAVAGLV